jgi:hypothetical protein
VYVNRDRFEKNELYEKNMAEKTMVTRIIKAQNPKYDCIELQKLSFNVTDSDNDTVDHEQICEDEILSLTTVEATKGREKAEAEEAKFKHLQKTGKTTEIELQEKKIREADEEAEKERLRLEAERVRLELEAEENMIR